MIDPKRRHGEAAAFEDYGRIARQRKGPRRSPATAAWHDCLAVMGNPVAVIERIGSIEARHDLLDAFGAIDGQRSGARPAGPVEQHQRADAVDMVRMEMG